MPPLQALAATRSAQSGESPARLSGWIVHKKGLNTEEDRGHGGESWRAHSAFTPFSVLLRGPRSSSVLRFFCGSIVRAVRPIALAVRSSQSRKRWHKLRQCSAVGTWVGFMHELALSESIIDLV